MFDKVYFNFLLSQTLNWKNFVNVLVLHKYDVLKGCLHSNTVIALAHAQANIPIRIIYWKSRRCLVVKYWHNTVAQIHICLFSFNCHDLNVGKE